MSVQILDKTNTKAPRVILIDENYCLNDSFDIIQTNFQTLLNALNQLGDTFQGEKIIDRYYKNKEKYQKFLTFVTQFSGNWVSAAGTYKTYKNIWNNLGTPLEIVYPEIIDIGQWGNINTDNTISENVAASLMHTNNILNWVNSRYPVDLYGLYKKINIRIYIQASTVDSFRFKVAYKEMCDPGMGGKVCCDGCPNVASAYGSHACNHSIVNGHGGCANMYDWCPGRDRVQGFSSRHHGNSRDEQVVIAKGYVHSKECADGSCEGWGQGFNKKNWEGKLLEIDSSLSGNDNRIIGTQILKLQLNETNLKWEKI